ncbi:hypothetical protein [Saccharibacillus sacchari]|uniref:Uncharacterized protein n=1 Tax=Saccharibacillus sacchari TaxID=456493 RepID=A0ACC6PIC0_9BACL
MEGMRVLSNCMFFLIFERHQRVHGREKIAAHAKRQHDRYRAQAEEMGLIQK